MSTPSLSLQTLKALRNRQHPYRQALDSAFSGRVTVMDIGEALYISRSSLDSDACIVVSTLANPRVQETEGRKVYENNGALMSHFSGLPADLEPLLEKADGQVIYSLTNLFRLHRPLVIVDEAHNARTGLSFEVLARFNPACIVEFSATPAPDSNVLAHASAAELQVAGMIKLPIQMRLFKGWRESLGEAIRKRDELEKIARAEAAGTGETVRPILLLQAQDKDRHRETLTAGVLEAVLQKDFEIPADQIRIATGEFKGIQGLDLFDPTCAVRFIITVDALAEGWDCSFAYVLCSVAEVRSHTRVEQILGRVLRTPYARPRLAPELNKAYAYITSQDFANSAAPMEFVQALINNGFQRFEAQQAVQPTQPSLPSFFSSQPTTRLSPAEQGVPFAVPCLTVKIDGQPQLWDERYLPEPWDLAKCDPSLTPEEYSLPRMESYALEIYLSDDHKLREHSIGILHSQMALLEHIPTWGANDLAVWLDRNIPHDDLNQLQVTFFLRRMIDYLLELRGLTLHELIQDRFRLRDAAVRKISAHRQAAKKAGFNLCLDPTMRPQIEVSPDFVFRFAADQYDPNWYYEGGYDFQKHYFKAVGELPNDSDAEEFKCARYLDQLPEVKFWVRNLSRKGFWLPTSSDRFYPDFVAQLVDGRYLVIEYKGGDRLTTEDSTEKRQIGDLWEMLSAGQGLFVMPSHKNYDEIRQKIAK